MDVAEHISELRRQGELLAAAAARVELDTPVPTCPEWRVRDLVRHVGGVHRWAATYVAESRTERMDQDDVERMMASWPGDDRLIDWFREGHLELVRVLEEASPDVACWSFLLAPSPLAFWARRQAHETAIHRADAESPGAILRPFSPAFASDGIDELLFGFVSRPRGRLIADPARTIHVRSTDADADWFVHIGPERVEVSRHGDEGDCAVRGSASDLYLLLWNRLTADGLQVEGDRSLLDLWRESVQIRWS